MIKILAFIICFYSSSAICFPVANDISYTSSQNGYSQINFTWIDVPGLPNADVLSPSISSVCAVTVLIDGLISYPSSRNWSPNEPLEHCANQLINNPVQLSIRTEDIDGSCVSIRGFEPPPSGEAMLGPDVCITLPPVTGSCSILNSPVIDHGIVNEAGIYEAKDLLQIQCDTTSQLSVKFINDNLSLADGLSTILSSSASQPIIIPAGISQVTITSTLSVQSNALIGPYSASTIAILEYL
ncbi:TPA: hypothetical protein ACKFAD_002615 [Citrobacter koseri]